MSLTLHPPKAPVAKAPKAKERVYPPGPKRSFPPGAFVRAIQRDPIQAMTRMAREYGDLSHASLLGRHIYLLNHPDYIKAVLVTQQKNFKKSRALQKSRRVLGNGLLTSEGEFHLRQRRLAQPAFHRQRIANYTRVMVNDAAQRREQWQNGATLDIHQEMMSLTLAIVAKTLFDADVEHEAKEVGEALTTILGMFQRLTSPFEAILEQLPLESNRRFQRAKERLDETIEHIIIQRRASEEDHGDLLSMLMQATDDEGDGGQLTNQQLRDEVMTLFLAGHETTANLLTWTWYLLSQNPVAEAKLHAELDGVLVGRLPTSADIPHLSYTAKVVSEAMRLYPPAWVVSREAIHDFELAGYTIPAKSILFMSQYIMHRDPRYYAEPERFNPDRWTAEMKTTLPRFAYFPFGGGPRICIGESFAWSEAILLVATLAQQWRMRLTPDQPVALLPQITLRPKYGMMMTLTRR